MTKFSYLLLLGLFIASSWGCRSTRPVVGRPGAEESAIRMEESRQEYEDCVAQRDVGKPNCDSLKSLYKKDRDEYESLAN